MNTLPDLGTMWSHDKHGLVLLTGITELAQTSFGETLYTIQIFRVKDQFHTHGIFGMSDWNRQFTHVA
tara:strand:+ start:768 stop:971 length:204 start_codon:yes stop_codon:yes gene_type:complete